ncbi:MAG: hypothetical protein WC969_13190 [Elusimicrobiota bacterium]|jgi:hypothetical protein
MNSTPAAATRRRILGVSLGLLAAYLLFQSLELRFFIAHESRPPGWDQANHLDVSLQYFRALKDGDWMLPWIIEPKHYIPPFPPLYHLALSWTYGTSNPAGNALWINGIYLLFLCLAISGLSWEEKKDERSVAVAIAFACSPIVQLLLHEQLIDLPLSTCTATAYWAWYRSENFTRRMPSILFGLAVAMGMLHKWSFATYLLPAFITAILAARRPGSRANVLAALLPICAFALPWYAVRIPLILQRLIQASADYAVPFWRRGAFIQYLFQFPEELGAFFSVCSLCALFLPHRDSRARVLALSVLVSYVFWSVVPNRQTRYLLPGLTLLPVFIAWTIPRRLLWTLALLQFAGAMNRTFPVVGPFDVHLPGTRYTTFDNFQSFKRHVPRSEDWKLAEMLRRCEGGGLSVIANHRNLNNLNLIWTARQLGLPTRIQAAQNKLWDLEPCVLLKRGDLGPPLKVDGLAEARAAVLRPDGAFARAFAEAGRWPLPDGDEAVLYRARESLPRPFPGSAVSAPNWTTPLFSLRDVRLRVSRWDARRGVYGEADVRAREAVLPGGVPLSGIALELRDARLLPEGDPSRPDGLRLAGLGGLRVLAATLEEGSLRRALAARGVRIDALAIDDGIRLAGVYRRIPFSTVTELECGPSPTGGAAFRTRLLALRVAGIPVPLFGGVTLLEASSLEGTTRVSTPLWARLERDFPFALAPFSCEVRGGRVRLSN